MAKIQLSTTKRKRLIAQISKASGVAQYAMLKKMTDEEVIRASQNLEILELLRASNNYNRYCQGQRTGEANKKLKEFTDLHNSEIVKAGKWLFNALSKTGNERRTALLEQDLVHREDYNEAVSDMGDTITELDQNNEEITLEAQEKIQHLEDRIDALKSQQIKVQQYITEQYGSSDWKIIQKTFKLG